MKKSLLAIAAALLSISAIAAPMAKAPRASQAMAPQRAATLSTPYVVAALYDDNLTTPNYYLVLSDKSDAQYSSASGSVTLQNGYLLCLDLYNQPTTPPALLPGVYNMGGGSEAAGIFTFNGEYTYIARYENGQEVSSIAITTPITVTRDSDGVYGITVEATENGNTVTITFQGRINLSSISERPTVYPQLLHDVTANLRRGGLANYQGVTDYTLNGVTYLNLYSAPFNNETGAMVTSGYHLCMLIAHKRFVRASDFTVVPGEYDMATTLARDTWYPGREVEYHIEDQSITMPFGSYIRYFDASKDEDRYTYGYLAEGKLIIEKGDDGKYSGTFSGKTDRGYSIECQFSGDITLNTSEATFPTVMSSLTDDVNLDFHLIKTGRVYYRGVQGGCNVFTLDIGSPSGKDEAMAMAGGDLMRFEVLSSRSHRYIESGLYPVVLRRWNDYELASGATYPPMSLNKFHFTDKGGLDGTRYAHFMPGGSCVYDVWAPIEEGTVRFIPNDTHDNYKIEIDLTDDAGFLIKGTYEGPVELSYNPQAIEVLENGIETTEADRLQVAVVGTTIAVANAPEGALYSIHSTSGTLVASGIIDGRIDASNLTHGIYILRVAGKTAKISL